MDEIKARFPCNCDEIYEELHLDAQSEHVGGTCLGI